MKTTAKKKVTERVSDIIATISKLGHVVDDVTAFPFGSISVVVGSRENQKVDNSSLKPRPILPKSIRF